MRFLLDAQGVVDEVLLGLLLVEGGGMFGDGFLSEVFLADLALEGHLGALSEMVVHVAGLNLCLTELAGDLYFRDDFTRYTGLVPLECLGSTARALSKPLHNALDARLTVDLGAALHLYSLLGQLQTHWTCEALLDIH